VTAKNPNSSRFFSALSGLRRSDPEPRRSRFPSLELRTVRSAPRHRRPPKLRTVRNFACPVAAENPAHVRDLTSNRLEKPPTVGSPTPPTSERKSCMRAGFDSQPLGEIPDRRESQASDGQGANPARVRDLNGFRRAGPARNARSENWIF